LTLTTGQTGAVTLIQRFGSALLLFSQGRCHVGRRPPL